MDRWAQKEVDIKYKGSAEMQSDALTKPIASLKHFEKCRDKLINRVNVTMIINTCREEPQRLKQRKRLLNLKIRGCVKNQYDYSL